MLRKAQWFFWMTKFSEMLFYNKRNICSQTLEMQDDQGVRQQFNAQSSFLDADNVYGYSEQRAKQVEFTQFLMHVKFVQNEISFSSCAHSLMVC